MERNRKRKRKRKREDRDIGKEEYEERTGKSCFEHRNGAGVADLPRTEKLALWSINYDE